MKKRWIFKYVGFWFMVLLLMVPSVCTGYEEGMYILKAGYDLDLTRRHQWFPTILYNHIDDEFIVTWRTSGKLRDDCGVGDDYECTTSFQTIDARRISPDGELLGDLIQWSPPEPGWKQTPRIAHNFYKNEYVVVFSKGADFGLGAIYVVRTDNLGNILYGPELLHPGEKALLPDVIFNSVRREYLVVYNDYNVFNEYNNNVFFILNEDGIPIKGPFAAGDQFGIRFAPDPAYNPTDDTYLLAWEDFRGAESQEAWFMGPNDARGVLLDGEGNLITEVAYTDDNDVPVPEGSYARTQWSPGVTYNPDKNEFFCVWTDSRPECDDGCIYGRVVNADGSLEPEVLIEDSPRAQATGEVIYIPNRKMYFVAYSDARDYVRPPGAMPYINEYDIYGRWLDDTGQPTGEAMPFFIQQGKQHMPEMAYHPGKDRILIVWEDEYAPKDFEPVPGGDLLWTEEQREVKGVLYGAPPETTSTCPALKIYGENSEETDIMRNFRDNVLKQTPEGQSLIKLYYQWSPVIVKAMERDEEFKEKVKQMIDGVLGLVVEETE